MVVEFILFLVSFVEYFLYLTGIYLVFCRAYRRLKAESNSLAFMHPYWQFLLSNDAGGGERVLWIALKALQEKFPKRTFYIYAADVASNEEIINKTEIMFQTKIDWDRIVFVRLRFYEWINPSHYKFLTMIRQFFGSFLLTHEAILRCPVSTVIDTHGQPFGYMLLWIWGIQTISYVHYPAISSDMLNQIVEQRPNYNNTSRVAQSQTLSKAKQLYYRVIMLGYGLQGKVVSLAMCNSNWTANHIRKSWKTNIQILYPPCSIKPFYMVQQKAQGNIISIGQFRPEKDHQLQILSLQKLIVNYPKSAFVKFFMVGSCRHEQDYQRVEELKILSKQLNVDQNIEFCVNVSFDELLDLVAQADIGLHTMWNEHFGINIIEMQAAGLAVIAHNSGGPKEDIIQNEINGFLAQTPEEYAQYMNQILQNQQLRDLIRRNAKESSKKYNEENFNKDFISFLSKFYN